LTPNAFRREAWTVRYQLPVSGPIDLDLTFSCGQAFRWVREGDSWRGIVGRADLEVTLPDPALLAISVQGEDPGPEALIRYFRLDQDPRAHLEHAEELRALPGILPLFGLRLLEQDPWETLASFISSAAANLLKIGRCVEAVARRWGEPIPGSPRRTFPGPAMLARAGERGLRSTGLGFRAPYLLETARRAASPEFSWDALRGGSYAGARARLCELPGVGPKIADCTLLFGLGRLEAYPVDRWIRRATLELWSRRRAKDEELSRWAARFGPGRGYLQQLLFHLRRTQGPLPPLRRNAARARRIA
jgi:N-glycosylase/DNA lyase